METRTLVCVACGAVGDARAWGTDTSGGATVGTHLDRETGVLCGGHMVAADENEIAEYADGKRPGAETTCPVRVSVAADASEAAEHETPTAEDRVICACGYTHGDSQAAATHRMTADCGRPDLECYIGEHGDYVDADGRPCDAPKAVDS